MISVDTNVILRFLTGQPAAQFEAAKALFEKGDLFISSPAVFEVFFTLTGSVLGFSDGDAFDALDALFALNGIQVQDRTHFEAAIRLARRGVPFKDACILAFSSEADEVATFDRQFIKRAIGAGAKPVVRLP